MNNQLSVGGIVQNGLQTGLKNATALLGAVGLWLVTLWIPYLNVGTTIGLIGLVAAMSRGEVIRPTEIFKAQYRERMGEFFLVIAFVGIGVVVGLAFIGIPGVVIGLTWMFAPLLVVDQGLNPSEALTRSNALTSGRKVTIFFGLFLTNFAAMAVVMLVTYLGGLVHGFFGFIFALAGYVLVIAVGMGAQAFVYGTLTGNWPKSEREVNEPVIIGGAIGAAVVSIALLAGVNAIHRHYMMKRFEEEWSKSRADYGSTNYGSGRYAPAAQVAPSLSDEPAPPPQKNVAMKPAPKKRK